MNKKNFDWNGFWLGVLMSWHFILLGVIIVANALYPSIYLVLLYVFVAIWSIIYANAALNHGAKLAVEKYKKKLEEKKNEE